MSCTVESRNRVRRAANALGDLSCVVAVDVLAPDVAPTGEWTLEAVVAGNAVPPSVLRELVLQDLSLGDATPQGPAHVVVEARP